MNWVTRPFNWASAHREITFTLDYENVYTIFGSSDVGGKVAFAFYSDGIHALDVGDYLFVDSGVYKGLHKVTEIFSSQIYITDTDYISAVTSGTLRFIEDHTFIITAGYGSGHPLNTLKPEVEVAEFKPEVNQDGQLVFNISGYLNKVFDLINSNDTTTIGASTVYYNLFNQYQLWMDGAWIFTGNVLNAAITQFELNRDYVGTNRSLNGGSLGNHFLSCGDSINLVLSGDFVIQGTVYEDAIPVPVAADFSPGDFNTNDFKTTGG